MALPIIGADERLAQRKGIKGVIFGRSGIGKTSLLWTLNASTTLFLDLEAGDLAVEGWRSTRSGPAPGRNAATSRCSSAGRTRRCARTSPTARRISTRSAGATAIRR